MALLLALTLTAACARIGSPDGGPYDETPPKIVKTSPKLGAANEKNAKKIIDIISQNLATEPLARIDYVEVVDFENIQRVETIEGETLVAIAVYIGKTRLIDNFIVK